MTFFSQKLSLLDQPDLDISTPDLGKNDLNRCAMVNLGGVGVWVITLKYNQHVFFLKNVFFFFFFEIGRNRPNGLNISPILAKMALFDLPHLK